MVKSVAASRPDTFRVELNDGRVQEIKISGLDTGKDIGATVTETRDGQILRTESTVG